MDISLIWGEGLLNQIFKAVSVGPVAGVAITIASVIVFCIVLPYLLGSVNLSIMISNRFYHDDIRLHGSGNAGMTNVMRTYGKKMAVLTFVGDFLKAVVASVLGRLAFGLLGAFIAGMFCFIGHIFPIFYKFKGGKGVVTACAMMFMTDLRVFGTLFIIFVLVVAVSKYISLGSVVCILAYPLILDRYGLRGWPVLIGLLMAVLCTFAHRENIKRIMKGTENRFTFKVKHKKTVDEEKAEESDGEES